MGAAVPDLRAGGDGRPQLAAALLPRRIPRPDDHGRAAYAEMHDDETAATANGVLRRAVAWFTARGITVQHVLTDHGSAYRSWRDSCAGLGITAKRTRPHRPQTNGKIERFHRTLADG